MPAAIKSVVTVPYASLLNAKIIEPVHDNYVLIDRHFLTFCMQPILARIKIDENWYLDKYPDVLLAIENDVMSNAVTHYTKHGYFENRMPYRIEVDADWYLEEYPDIRLAIERGEFASAQDHFDVLLFVYALAGFRLFRGEIGEFGLPESKDERLDIDDLANFADSEKEFVGNLRCWHREKFL